MKILIDMNLAPRWAALFSKQGITAVHWKDTGAPDAPDTEIIDYAARNGYTVFTRDLDFSAHLATRYGSRPSVVQIRMENICPEELIDRVVRILAQYSTDIEQGALVTIEPHKTRLHILPFAIPKD